MSYESFMSGYERGVLAGSKPTAPFLVFADKAGYAAPTFRHQTRAAAETEAKRLANLNPGVSYYVLGSVSLTSARKPEATTWSLV